MSKGLLGKSYSDFEKQIDKVKWFLWHGNIFKALDRLEFLAMDLDEFSENKENKKHKLWKAVKEFLEYIRLNSPFIPNYSERYHYREAVSSAIAESTVNEVVSRRMAKNQQMRWTQKGAHLLLQVRTKTLNNELKDCFKHWYPQMNQNHKTPLPLAA